MIIAQINSSEYEYKNATLDSYAYDEEALKIKPVIEKYANRLYSMKEGRNLVLWSNGNGRGKDFLSYAILKKVREFDQPIWNRETEQFSPMGNVRTVAVNFTPLMKALKGFGDEEKKFQHLFYTCDYLAINEMATSKNYADDDELLDLFNHRIADFKPIIISTNYSPEQFKNTFGQSIFSKLQSRTDFIEIPGTDKRPALKELNDEKV